MSFFKICWKINLDYLDFRFLNLLYEDDIARVHNETSYIDWFLLSLKNVFDEVTKAQKS